MIIQPAKLIDALGGNSAVADMLGVGPSAVSNYRKTGFPAWTHRRLLSEAAAREIVVDDSMFVAEKPQGRPQKIEAA